MAAHPRLAILVLLGLLHPARAAAPAALPLAVHDGRCTFTVKVEHQDDQFDLVIGSLALLSV